MKSLDFTWKRSHFYAATPGKSASVRSRVFVLTIVLLLHVAALVALIRWGTVPASRDPAPSLPITLTLPDPASDAGMSAAPETAVVAPKAADKPLPMPIAPEALPIPLMMPLPSEEAEPIDFGPLTPRFDAEPDPALTGDVVAPAPGSVIGQGTGGGCGLGEAVREALERNVKARMALEQIPQQSRSVANAILLWNGEWLPAEGLGGPFALVTLQKTITDVIMNAPTHCQLEIEPGPVFVIVNGVSETMVVALGSGAWRWIDLLQNGT